MLLDSIVLEQDTFYVFLVIPLHLASKMYNYWVVTIEENSLGVKETCQRRSLKQKGLKDDVLNYENMK